jgi:hypothetical protein
MTINATTFFLQKHSMIVALKQHRYMPGEHCDFQLADTHLWSQFVLSEYRPLSSMQKKDTSPPSDTDSTTTWRPVVLFLSGTASSYITMFQLRQPTVPHDTAPWNRTDTRSFEMLHLFYKTPDAAWIILIAESKARSTQQYLCDRWPRNSPTARCHPGRHCKNWWHNLTTRNPRTNTRFGLTSYYASIFIATRAANTLVYDYYHLQNHCHYPGNTMLPSIFPYA